MPQISYQPIFQGHLPADVTTRWSLIRAFINFWCLPEHAPLIDRSTERTLWIERAESLIAGSISPAIRQWLALAEEASIRQAPLIRDCLLVEPLEKHLHHPNIPPATIILMQGEGDIFWTVANDRWVEEDPPVDVYQSFDEDASPYFVQYKSVSEFALAYICTYNSFAINKQEAFTAFLSADQRKEVRCWFDYSLVLESQNSSPHRFLELLEKKNLVAFVSENNRLEITMFCNPDELEMPQLLRSALREQVRSRKEYKAMLGR